MKPCYNPRMFSEFYTLLQRARVALDNANRPWLLTEDGAAVPVRRVGSGPAAETKVGWP